MTVPTSFAEGTHIESPGFNRGRSTEDELATVLWACAGQNGGLEALLADYAERRLGVSWSRLSAGLSTHLVGSAQGQAACREALFLFANEAACACAEGRAA